MNVAGLRYEAPNNGPKGTLFAASVPLSQHAEEVLLDELARNKIDRSWVKEIYSELQPCTLPNKKCARLLEINFPQADVTWSIDYGETPSARDIAMRALKRAVVHADQYELRLD